MNCKLKLGISPETWVPWILNGESAPWQWHTLEESYTRVRDKCSTGEEDLLLLRGGSGSLRFPVSGRRSSPPRPI